MLTVLFEAALRSALLATLVWLSLRLFRVRNPKIELLTWAMVLAASLAMPALVCWAPLPDPLTSVGVPAVSIEILSIVPRSPSPWWNIGGAIYEAVAALLTLRLLVGLALTWRILRRSASLAPFPFAPVNVRTSTAISSPLSFGSWIFLPATYAAWPRHKLRAVLAHEQSHVERGDFYLMAIAALHRALFWFSPLSWWLPQRLAILTEIISDGAAVAEVGDRTTVADILLDFAAGWQPANAVGMARPATLAVRIDCLLAQSPLYDLHPRYAALLLTAMITVTAIVAAVGKPALPRNIAMAVSEHVAQPIITALLIPTHRQQQPVQVPVVNVPRLAPAPISPALPEIIVAEPTPVPETTQTAEEPFEVVISTRKTVPPKVIATGSSFAYPETALRNTEEGVVLVRMTVGAAGEVTATEILHSSGFKRLDAAADKLVRSRRFAPGTIDGKPAAMEMDLRVVFKLRG